MSESLIRVYSGVTLENFRTCTSLTESGLYIFDKSKEERYDYPRTFRCLQQLEGAYHFATVIASELGHTPIVISGLLKTQLPLSFMAYPEAKPFTMDEVWIPGPLLNRSPYLKLEDIGFLIRFTPDQIIQR